MSEPVKRKTQCDADITFGIRRIVRETDDLKHGFLAHLRLRSQLRHNIQTQQSNGEKRPAGSDCESSG